jgi:tRNA A37 threonylcarbamoyltransferase TsaD
VEYGVAKQLCERVQRGIEYLDTNNMWATESDSINKRTLVVSGGVASNQRIRNLLEQVNIYVRYKSVYHVVLKIMTGFLDNFLESITLFSRFAMH